MSDCGGCKHFTKMTQLKGSSGLCELFDSRTSTDCGHRCKEFKRKPYVRMAKLVVQNLGIHNIDNAIPNGSTD